MNRLLTFFLLATCLLVACRMSETGNSRSASGQVVDSAAILQDMAYQELFNGSLAKAEVCANRAFLLSRDSTLENNALSLLCYIYYREGRQQELELLMQSVTPATYMNALSVQSHVEQSEAVRRQLVLVSVVILLLLLLGVLGMWYVFRMKALSRRYRQRIVDARRELRAVLQRLAETPSPSPETCSEGECRLDIGETKMGVDVLFAIINDQNISQMGKREEQAALKTLPMVDAALAAALSTSSSPLTPKETFFCMMEYFGKTDSQKARSFCCSEQAIRSTKSRLSRKMDISVLRAD